MKASLLIVVLLTAFLSCAPPDAQEVEKRISQSTTLQDLNQLCSDLPKPSDFKFVYKQISGNSGTTSLSFEYRSSLEIAEVNNFYNEVLPPLGWKFGRSNDWENGNRRLSISNVDYPAADYSIYCAVVH